MKYNNYLSLLSILLIITFGARAMNPGDTVSGDLTVRGGEGYYPELPYFSGDLTLPTSSTRQPASLAQFNVHAIAQQVVDGTLTLEQAQKKLPVDLHDELLEKIDHIQLIKSFRQRKY